MRPFTVFTDSCCDVTKETLAEWGMKFIPLSFQFENEDVIFDGDIDLKEFYGKMRDGGVARTSAINVDRFVEAFRGELEKGNDVLYLGFSSGISATCNFAKMAADDLAEEFPDRKIVVVDTLSASAGHALVLYLAMLEMRKGLEIEEVEKFVKEIRLSICHWFTVDDLKYLKRGGRVSAATAVVGTMLGIKPVLHMDDTGKLVSVSKARGRKSSIKALAEKLFETVADESAPVFISHSDCIEDANLLKSIIEEGCNAKVELITNIGSVVGAHSGPGTLALFFVGTKR